MEPSTLASLIAFCVIVVIGVIACCKVSGDCSREEEKQQ